jgi:cell division protein FtsB
VKKQRKSFIFKLACCAFVIYIAMSLINMQFQISKQKTLIVSLKNQYQEQLGKNVEKERVLAENSDQYKESIARDKLGYAKPNERIYINVSGD